MKIIRRLYQTGGGNERQNGNSPPAARAKVDQRS